MSLSPHLCARTSNRKHYSAAALLCFGYLLATIGTWASAALAQTAMNAPAAPVPTPDPFAMFALDRDLQLVTRQLRAGQFAAAEKQLRKSAARHPRIGELSYTLAVVLARQGKLAAALKSLEAAINAGFGTAARISNDANLTPLRSEARFAELVAQAGKTPTPPPPAPPVIEPSLIADGTALVTSTNSLWDGRIRILRSFFKFTPKAREGLLVHEGTKPVARMLNRWYARGRAAGNHGDLYDNRDRDHSNLKPGRLLQIAYVEYSDAARSAGANYRLNTQVFFNAATIGNSSLALTGGPLWRSQPRLALVDPDSVKRLYVHYINNHLYVYPEHRDHDPEYGDLFPANTPYMIISQGSSGSDQPFVHAAAAILAAFTPETKAFLRHNHLISPTVQMVFRRSTHLVERDGDYLKGAAHPAVFQASDIDLPAMISRANALTPDDIPPNVVLTVLEESVAQPGIDHFNQVGAETLFDTPGAIARIVRSTAHTKRLVVSAEQTRDPNGRPLAFRWAVLRGDAARITVRPLNANASKAELIVPWHEQAPVPGRPDLASSRVDIGVFADNGSEISAPAFVSLAFPPNQLREYDDHRRIARIDYRDPDRAKRYADPVLFPIRDWADVYDYGPDGRLTGWSRMRGAKTARYTRHGARVLETDPQGRAIKAVAVRYELEPQANGASKVTEHDTDRFFHYVYRDETDRHGTLSEAPQE